jgi:hypothetical protein
MTQTPDPALAALAVQLAALKGTLGQAREDLETAKRDLAARIDQVASDLAAQAVRDPKGPAATCWPALDADARTAALAALTEWVAVMRQWHPSYFEPVADCWASHPEVVIELHNVMTEFTRVYRMPHPLLPGVQDADEGVTDGADVKAPPGVFPGGAFIVWVSPLSAWCRCAHSSRSSLTAVRVAVSSTIAFFAANVATSDCRARLLTARG